VTSGYCPRYRYTLIATLTLDNLYYICVYFLPTHTIGESVLPAHFLRAFFVGRSGVRRSFHVDRLFGPRSCGNPLGHIRWVIRAHLARWVILFRGSHSFGSFFVRVYSLSILWFRSCGIRAEILFVGCMWASLPFVSCMGLFVRDSK
jgi:hypothetical protein